MITQFKIFENKDYRVPEGMDKGFYEFLKKELKGSSYGIKFTHGYGDDSAEDVGYDFWDDEDDISDNTYVQIFNINLPPIGKQGTTNVMEDYIAPNFNYRIVYENVLEREGEVSAKLYQWSKTTLKLYKEYYDYIIPVIEKYKNTEDYHNWKIGQEAKKYNI